MLKLQMGQGNNQKENQKTLWDEWKLKQNIPKLWNAIKVMFTVKTMAASAYWEKRKFLVSNLVLH